MRGIFSAGVLDSYLAQGYQPFDFCLGVSAGSTSLASWLSRQPKRTYKVITDYSCRPEFIDFIRYMKGGHWIDLDWLWEITLRELPYDISSFQSQPTPLYVVTTDINTGEPIYTRATPDNLNDLLKASCSVPLAYRGYPQINGQSMTDGGVADSIPVIKAYEMGAREITVILSRPEGYRKPEYRSAWVVNKLFKEHPVLANAMLKRAEIYNQAMAFIESPPVDCKVTVIVPPKTFAVGRLTTDFAKLEHGYQQGYAAGKSHIR
ncbi:phospholipase [Photobacterium aquae]|uniref:Phospholipase n=2 Tax=Photobacterium aquae TaxID=1195763 RepID=A0A0J1H0X7_9GAMM|nr:phospholipase [Photobacterium aquae]